ncbi:MAG: S9 family peptidase [Negativicutes bacterium]|nr:S9 family peptidase [Negativicutes bacterium]
MNKRPITIDDFMGMKFPGDCQLSPDGQHIVYVHTVMDLEKNGYKSTLWLLDKTDEGWSAPHQFTYPQSSDKLIRDTAPRWTACGKGIYFMSNRSGKNQLWIIALDGGEAKQVTTWEEGLGGLVWNPSNGNEVAFSSFVPGTKPEQKNKDMRVITKLRYKFNGMGFLDPRNKHLFVMNLKTGEYKQITDGKFSEASPAWSPDGKKLAFVSSRLEDDEINEINNVWTVDIASGEIKAVSNSEGTAHDPLFSPDGKWIAYLGHEKGQGKNGVNTSILVRPVEGGAAKNLTEPFDYTVGNNCGGDARADGGNGTYAWVGDSSALYALITVHGETNLYRFDLNDGSQTMVTTGKHAITSFSAAPALTKDGNMPVAYVLDGSVCASNIYYKAPEMTEGIRLTELNQALLNEVYVAGMEPISTISRDQVEVHGWLLKPINYDPEQKYPLVLNIHGGPYGASGYAYFFEYQLLAANGYAVLISNPRGSATYGEKHALGVIGDWGGGDYADLMNITDQALKDNTWLDASRCGVIGGSYGGYMTNWMITQTNRFKAAVSLRSISNMYTKYGVSDIGWVGNKSGMGGVDLWDKGGEEFIMSRSPIRYAPNVRTPVLFMQSEEDYRCPMEQAEQFYVALMRLGNKCEFVRFAGENHELSRSGKPMNRQDRLRQIMRWFDTYLMK